MAEIQRVFATPQPFGRKTRCPPPSGPLVSVQRVKEIPIV
jgi:hypothetical protein